MSDRFFFPGSLQSGPLVIEGPEAHHLARVCRLAVADALTLFNGDGFEYPAHITGIDRRRVIVEVGDAVKVDRELGFPLTIAAAVAKGDRIQVLIEKLTELGVTAFVPLATRRSVVRPGDAKLEKLERCVIEASKQCGRNVLMAIEPVTAWDEFCRRGNLPGQRYMAHPGGAGGKLPCAEAGQSGVAFAIGPEGGFTDEEVRLARDAGWSVIDLGPRILRIETAALALAAACGIADTR